jgi:uncharacterized membrane protein
MIVLGAINPKNIIINGQCLIYNNFFVIYGSVVSFVIPLIIVIITYVLTVRRLKEQIRQCQEQLDQEKLSRAASLVVEPFLRRHIPTRSAAAAATANSLQTTSISAIGSKRVRLIRQQTSLELSEESADNTSLQQQQQQPSDQESQIEEKSIIPRNHLQQTSSKFSPHTEYPCPKNPFCQLKCTCNHHHEQQLETVLESKSYLNCFNYIFCCETTSTTPPTHRCPSLKSHPMTLSVSTAPNQSSNHSTSDPPMRRNRRKLTITPSLRMSHTKSSAVRNEQKAVKVLGVVFFIFVIAWFPFCIMNLLQGVCKRCAVNPNILNGLVWLGYVSSTINPLVYTIFNRNFRLKFITLLKCHCLYPTLQRRQFSYYQSYTSVHGSRLQRKNGLLQDSCRLNTYREQ